MDVVATELKVREARREDCPALMKLVNELAVYERAPEQVTVTLQHFEESGFGSSPVWWAYVAEIDGEIVAFALYYIRYSTWKGQRMYLEDIIVTEKWRRHGIGHKLMDALIKVAKEKGFSGIAWQVLDWNESAISFYEDYKPEFDHGWINVAINF